MITLAIAAMLIVVVLAYRAGRSPVEPAGRLARALDSRGIVVLVFAITFVVIWYTWATWNPFPAVHDEMAYVLQSRIFARGRWALDAQPIPAFWEQPYILVEPTVASKYFPGHSILLTIGAAVRWPALMPLLLQSTIGALLFVLARRVANGGVAFVAWVIWLTSPIVLLFGPTFYSEATTTVCWLAGWYALLEWRATRRLPWLLAVAVLTGWCVLTRPLTGLAYAIPMGVIVLRDAVAGRRWRDLALAFGAGLVVLAIIPLWSARTTGDWRLTPLELYTRGYMPYDLPGFGLITTPPTRTLYPEFAHLNEVFAIYHQHHYPSTLLPALLKRVHFLASGIWGVSRGLFQLFGLIGLLTLTGATAFAVASSVLLLLVYLSFATPPEWTLYYYESVPTYAFLTAAGLAWTAAAIGRWRLPSIADASGWRSPRWTRALVAGALVLCIPGAAAVRSVRREQIRNRLYLTRFEQVRASIPDPRAVLFVRYANWHNPHYTYVRNVADPTTERLWVVYDRGASENARLLALAPDRVAYLFDEARNTTGPYDPRGAQ